MKLTKALFIPLVWSGLTLIAWVVAVSIIVMARSSEPPQSLIEPIFSANEDDILHGILLTVIFAVSTAGYLLPSFIAGVRNVPNYTTILLINILGGWTVIGWIAALIWAITDRKEEKHTVVQQIIYRDSPMPPPEFQQAPRVPK